MDEHPFLVQFAQDLGELRIGRDLLLVGGAECNSIEIYVERCIPIHLNFRCTVGETELREVVAVEAICG